MQAHPQSFSASRLSADLPTTPARVAGDLHPSSGTTFPPPELHPESDALAQEAANILGALLLYSELLQQPGVLRHVHSHYGDELKELAHRSSALFEQLLERSRGSGSSAVPLLSAAAPPSPERPAVLPEFPPQQHDERNERSNRAEGSLS